MTPAPIGDADAPARALIFDSVYDTYRGVVTYVRVFDGHLTHRDRIKMMSNGVVHEMLEVGAAALHPGDSPAEHLHDTLVAGVGVCDVPAVTALVNEGPARVHELVGLGAEFDVDAEGESKLTREGGHRRDRIAHAGGDATGKEISRALIAALEPVREDPGIEVIEHALVVDLLQGAQGQVCGVTLHVIGEGQIDGVGAAHARAVVLATGGLGQVYSATTNPSVATGDGMAAALRAGAVMADLEFVQFHPTVLWLGEGGTGQQPLISEAVRGEGAFLVDRDGVRFMRGCTPRPTSHRATWWPAPSWTVCGSPARTTSSSTRGTSGGPSSRGASPPSWRVPRARLRPGDRPAPRGAGPALRLGRDPHRPRGRSSLEGLYACGEVSCTGVHGANRLASNSLLEGLVFAHRIADDITERIGGRGAGQAIAGARRPDLRRCSTPRSGWQCSTR